MVGANFMEEIDSGNFFDNIDDLLEFPNDDIDNLVFGKGGGSVISSDDFLLWQDNSVDSDLPAGSNSMFSGTNSNGTSDHSVEFSVPYEDIVQLEWLPSFVEHSSSDGGLTLEKAPTSPSTKESSRSQFKTSSPVSVLESSDACSNGTKITLINEKRPRSKRSRPAAFTPPVGISLTPPTSSIAETPQPLEREPKPNLGQQEKKKKRIKILPPSSSSSGSIGASQNQSESPNANNPRKCMHCEITKTPQWRAGPMGPKTLCNACGVRYKSGRLFPEYRPAASPTFVPSLHSNSHKKVLQMRNNIIAEKSKIENRS